MAAPAGDAAQPAAQLGAWSYRADPGDEGLREGWVQRPPAMAPVSVPHVANPSPLSGAGGRRAYAGSVGWWRAPLAVSGPGRYELRFGSVHHRATVWIDGEIACEHDGAYEPFACPATLAAGMHAVTLRANWRLPGAPAAPGLRPRVVQLGRHRLAGGAARCTTPSCASSASTRRSRARPRGSR